MSEDTLVVSFIGSYQSSGEVDFEGRKALYNSSSRARYAFNSKRDDSQASTLMRLHS